MKYMSQQKKLEGFSWTKLKNKLLENSNDRHDRKSCDISALHISMPAK